MSKASSLIRQCAFCGGVFFFLLGNAVWVSPDQGGLTAWVNGM